MAEDSCRLVIDVNVDRVHEETDWLLGILGDLGKSGPAPHPHYC